MDETYSINGIRWWEIRKALKMYKNSSEELKRKFYNPPPFTGVGLSYQYLSRTFLRPFLGVRFKVLVAKKGDEIIGLSYVRERKRSLKDRKDFGIMVKEGYQGKGVGSRLMAEVMKHQDDVWLTVLDDNESAIKLYEKNGFKFESMINMRKMRYKK